MQKQSLNHENEKETLSLDYLFNLIKRKWTVVVFVTFIFIVFAVYNAFFKRDVYVVKFCMTYITSVKNDPLLIPIETSTLETIVYNFITKYENKKAEINSGKIISNANKYISFNKLSVSPLESETAGRKTKTLEMSLFVYNTSYTKEIINDLIDYVNKNELIKNWFEQRNKSLINTKKNLESGLAGMINFKNKIRSGELRLYNFNFNIYRDIMDTKTEIAIIELKLKDVSAVYVVADPENPVRPTGLPPLECFVIFSLLGFFSSIILIILLDKVLILSKKTNNISI